MVNVTMTVGRALKITPVIMEYMGAMALTENYGYNLYFVHPQKRMGESGRILVSVKHNIGFPIFNCEENMEKFINNKIKFRNVIASVISDSNDENITLHVRVVKKIATENV